MNSPESDREGSRRTTPEKRATLSPVPSRSKVERSVSGTGNRRTAAGMDRSRVRQRQRSVSPSRQYPESDAEINDRRRSRDRDRVKKDRSSGRRRTRRISAGSASLDGEIVDWGRGIAKSPGRLTTPRTSSRGLMANRQVKQISAPPLATAEEDEANGGDKFDDSFGDLAASHPDAKPELKRSVTEPVSSGTTSTSSKRSSSDTKSKKRGSKTAILASSNDIDSVIAQFRDQCDIHMATLLELKNTITTTEKAVAGESEKEKEFQQVRQWYSALAEKHTKLQKEHQALQEEHTKLQEKYMTLRRASNLTDSFVANLAAEDKEDKKKDKKEKGKLEVVWSRAGKMTHKLHQKLTE